ncbi:hypothetical protein LSAT2_007080 [Lamellibrachia satsuma]|nr:hypothetical protein LSAT2_007080 [Lamellibrachia satsuma]
MVTEDGHSEAEVRRRTQMGANAWRKVEGIMLDRKIKKKLKGKVLRTCVTPACLYGLESVALTEQQQEIAQLRWAGHLWESGTVIHLAWSSREDLLCVQDDGQVLVYDIFGNIKRHFGMGQDAKDVGVTECQVYNSYQGTGIAVLTTTYRLFVVNNIDDVRIRRLQVIPGMEAAPSCWTIMNRDQSSLALMANQAELFLLDQSGKCDQVTPKMMSPASRFLAISVSFNNKYLALFTDNQLLWIGSSDLQSVYCELDTKCTMVPKQLVWCGTGAVVGYWENVLLLAGPKKDWIKYPLDGLRIIGQYSHEFLQRVPKAVEDILKIGSMASGALLYEAIKEFQKGSQRADEYIRLIQDTLDEAVAQCIEAAGHEWEPSKQKMLLRVSRPTDITIMFFLT